MALRLCVLFLAALAWLGPTPSQAAEGSLTMADYPQYGTDLPLQHRAGMGAFATAIVGALLAGSDVEVTVFGHADFDAKGRDFERQVSAQRASGGEAALRAAFEQAANLALLPAERRRGVRFLSVGLGTARPSFPSPRNEEERKANRRVEIVWKAVPGQPPDPMAKYQRCIKVLASGSPAGPSRRMSCACTKLLQQAPPVKDYFYDYRSAQQMRPGAGGLLTYTPQQWAAFYRALVLYLRKQIDSVQAGSDADYARGLVAIDDNIGRNLNDFMAQTATIAAGDFEKIVVVDIAKRMQDPNHIYSCYAGYSRARHNQ